MGNVFLLPTTFLMKLPTTFLMKKVGNKRTLPTLPGYMASALGVQRFRFLKEIRFLEKIGFLASDFFSIKIG
ncbi:hypothetical protein QUF54_00895 [Candidatus Marithioploca araucensis]|uniref:Uncharacterized protein n=1 Tax=Candidatus Marithioploca araucensis TaxID=70273 RepID=A0ABT7VQE4_9GAMM|nr:hypothetical protein [Candidatus Marithioploca araucensis]